MNKIVLLGRLTKDVELRYTTSNTPVGTFTLAVNRRTKVENQPDADFFNIVAWNKTAEFCSKYFKKGQQIALTGRLQTRSYDDKDGKKVFITEIIAEEVYFADSKTTSEEKQVDTKGEFVQPITDDLAELPF